MWCEIYYANGLASGGAAGGGATSGGATRGSTTSGHGARTPAMGPHGTPPDGLRLRAERLCAATGGAQVARTPPAHRRHRPRSARQHSRRARLGRGTPGHPYPSGRAAPVLTAGRFSRAALAPQVPRDDQAGRHMRRAIRRQAGGRRACACAYSFHIQIFFVRCARDGLCMYMHVCIYMS